ncbi:MAG: DNA damage-inducible protein D [Ramlibacter sp.]
MSSRQVAPVTAGFEALKLTNEYNAEYWSARDLQPLLGYSQWRRFEQAIERAKASCETSGNNPQNHFAGAGKMVDLGSGSQRPVDDYHLSRFACYLIAQNGDPRKPEIADAQQYFAVQTRRQELSDQAAADVERLELRKQTAEEFKALSGAAQDAGVQSKMFGVFHDAGYKGLYGGLGRDAIKHRKLDDARRELDLTIEKRVQDGLTEVRTQAKREAEDGMKLKVAEKDQAIASMQQKIEELKQKAEQSSEQLQGEVLELELEQLLRSKFPFDLIEPVPKGEFGGDALHRINSPSGMACGSILWESKRTRNWSDGWLSKLREDQRTAKAEVCVLVSQALPKGVDTFDLMDGVWITSPRAAIPVATMLRQGLLEVTQTRALSVGQQTKAEMVYQYLTGPRFKQRVEAIVEAFSSMQEDLDKERKVIMKQWAKRQEQIERVMGATVGMYGDLQGIAGKSLQEIEGLELPALEMKS